LLIKGMVITLQNLACGILIKVFRLMQFKFQAAAPNKQRLSRPLDPQRRWSASSGARRCPTKPLLPRIINRPTKIQREHSHPVETAPTTWSRLVQPPTRLQPGPRRPPPQRQIVQRPPWTVSSIEFGIIALLDINNRLITFP
jgi:hypothetical protein